MTERFYVQPIFDIRSLELIAILLAAFFMASVVKRTAYYLTNVAIKRTSLFMNKAFSHKNSRAEIVPIPVVGNLQKKSLLTNNEAEFFQRLTRALPDYWIFPQVSFNSLMETKGYLYWKYYFYLRNNFNRKVADYVVCDKRTLAVITVVELDDRTHNKEKDRKRDAVLRAAGYRILRYESRAKPSIEEIAATFGRVSAGERPPPSTFEGGPVQVITFR